MTYYIRSTDGTDYKVGVWNGGEWRDGDKWMALRELHGLNEPGAYVWGRTATVRGCPGPRPFVDFDGNTYGAHEIARNFGRVCHVCGVSFEFWGHAGRTA